MDYIIIAFAISICLNIILFIKYLIQKAGRKMMDKRYENAMEEVQRIRANYNDLINQSEQ